MMNRYTGRYFYLFIIYQVDLMILLYEDRHIKEPPIFLFRLKTFNTRTHTMNNNPFIVAVIVCYSVFFCCVCSSFGFRYACFVFDIKANRKCLVHVSVWLIFHYILF